MMRTIVRLPINKGDFQSISFEKFHISKLSMEKVDLFVLAGIEECHKWKVIIMK